MYRYSDSDSLRRLAYSLGLISEQALKNLTALGDIRNIFAHAHIHTDWTHPRVVELCGELITPLDGLPTGKDGISPLAAMAVKDTRGRFITTVAFLHSVLLDYAHKAERRKKHPGAW